MEQEPGFCVAAPALEDKLSIGRPDRGALTCILQGLPGCG